MEGIERIKVLSSEINDKALLKIIDYLLSRKDMNEKYLNEEKSLSQMVSFIKTEAQKKAHNGVAMIDDETVYSWAIHYFDESNEKLGLIKQKNQPVEIKAEEKSSIPTKLVKKVVKTDSESKIESKTQKQWHPEGQLTIDDFI